MISSIANKRGFTLVELLTVVVILAIVIAITIPAVRSFSSTAVQAAARQVSTTLQLTRQSAINNRLPTALLVESQLNSYPVGSTNLPRTDLVFRAYCVVEATNNLDGTLAGWIPVQDWKILPDGVMFADLTAGNTYTTMSTTLPPFGQATLSASAFANAGSLTIYSPPGYTTGYTWSGSKIIYRPAGGVAASMFTGGTMAGGLRIVKGTVINPSARTVLITDTSNWVYVEFDQFGRVRTRLADSYSP